MKEKNIIQKIKNFFSKNKTEREVNEKIAELSMEKEDRQIAEQMLNSDKKTKKSFFQKK